MNTNSDYQNNSEKEPSDMEQEINSTRARIGRTVEELEQRLSPGQLVDQALGYARDHGGEFSSNVASSIRRNPLPMIVTGVLRTRMVRSSGSRPLNSCSTTVCPTMATLAELASSAGSNTRPATSGQSRASK